MFDQRYLRDLERKRYGFCTLRGFMKMLLVFKMFPKEKSLVHCNSVVVGGGWVTYGFRRCYFVFVCRLDAVLFLLLPLHLRKTLRLSKTCYTSMHMYYKWNLDNRCFEPHLTKTYGITHEGYNFLSTFLPKFGCGP